jgi:hypothetical protein
MTSPDFEMPIARDNEGIHVNPVMAPGLGTAGGIRARGTVTRTTVFEF